MKQQGLTVQPTVLLYGFRDPARRKRICDWLNRAGIHSAEIAPTELHQPIGALLGLPGFSTLPGPWLGRAPEEEMLVLFALPGGALDRFLRFFREEGLAPVALKAMATPTNVQWSALELLEALRAEHAQIQAAKGKRLNHFSCGMSKVDN